jgi:protein-S-isoprenylcysteine O-methyltransferase
MSASLTWHGWLVILLYCCSEAALTLHRRAGHKTEKADQNSLAWIWGILSGGILVALLLEGRLPFADLAWFRAHHSVGIALFLAGLALRAYAVIHLGRFFTVNVAIASDHKVVDDGPYRWLRHPSYTGLLIAYLGIGLCLSNWVAVLVVLLPTTVVLVWRIVIEERALCAALGEEYRAYMQRTWRLIPFIY